MARSALLNVIVQAVFKAGRSLTRDFGEAENLQVSLKGPANFVSAADRRAEEILHNELSRMRPGWGFLMEEGGEIAGDGVHRWIIDPLDGTTNFLHGIPLFSISVALEKAGRIVAGVVYNPVGDELFVAERGSGAFLNNRRLRVANRRELADAVVVTGIPHLGRGNHRGFLAEMATIMPRVAGVRRTGSAALDLAWFAAGRYDAYWERGISAWDMAAGIVIAREAGGLVCDLDGSDRMLETGAVLATNGALQRPFLALLKKAAAAV